MEFYTTKYIHAEIIHQYLDFVRDHYQDIFSFPFKYIDDAESAILEYLGGDGAVSLLNSGTTALQFALHLSGVGRGDEVILPANTYSATAIAITNLGAQPIFADISLDDYTLDPESVRNCITKKTKAIIPVHIYGHACKMDRFVRLGQEYSLSIIEDASHAFGGEYMGRKLGTWGDYGAFSAHSSKNFGTFGNGGILWSQDMSQKVRIQSLLFPDSPSSDILFSGRTPAMIAPLDAISLKFKLPILDRIIGKNRELYMYLRSEYQERYGVSFPALDIENLHIRNMVALSEKRDILLESKFGRQYYSINLADVPHFNSRSTDHLTNTREFFRKNFAFNFYFGLTPVSYE